MEKIFIDANPFIYFLSDVKKKSDKVQQILENKENEFYTSYAVLNEVKFRLLMNKAIEEYKTNKKYELIKIINTDKKLRTSVMERYLKFFINMNKFVKVLDLDETTEEFSCSIIIENGLLPTDASIVANMLKNNIKKILTDDSDFKKVDAIEVLEIWRL